MLIYISMIIFNDLYLIAPVPVDWVDAQGKNKHMENDDQLTDEQLLSLSIDNQDCFYRLIKRYEPRLLRYILKMTQNKQPDAEDILQEVFIKVYRNQRGFNPNLKFSSWIYRIAHNEVISMYRKNKSGSRTIRIDDTDSDTQGAATIISDAFDIQEAYISEEIRLKLRDALNILPDKYRDVLILRYFEDQSYSEIGDILLKPQGTVATLINRAKSMLKKILNQMNLKENL